MTWQLQGPIHLHVLQCPTLDALAMHQAGLDQVLLEVCVAAAAVAAAAALLDFGCAAAAAAAALAAAALQVADAAAVAAALQIADAALLIHILHHQHLMCCHQPFGRNCGSWHHLPHPHAPKRA